MQLWPLLACPQERYLLFKIPQDYKHASSCQFAVHTPRILCWNKQKQKKLISVASRYFILRRRHSTAVADFPTTIHGLHFTIRFDKNVPSLSATFHSSQSKSTRQSSLRSRSHQNKSYTSEPAGAMYGRRSATNLFSALTANSTANSPTSRIITITNENTPWVNET